MRCVWFGLERSCAELDQAFRDLFEGGGGEELGLWLLSGGVDEVRNLVTVQVVDIDDARRAAVEELYGRGHDRDQPSLRRI